MKPLTLSDLVFAIRRRWRFLLLANAIFGAAAIAAIHVLNPTYTATMVVAPVQRSEDGISSNLRGAAGLAALAGIQNPLGGSAVAEFVKFRELLTSTALAELLVQESWVFLGVFSEESSPPSGPAASLFRLVRSLLGLPPWRPPDAQKLEDHLSDNLSIRQIAATGMYRISYEHEDPTFSVEFLRKIYAEANNLLRVRAEQRALSHIEHLRDRMDSVGTIEHRSVLSNLLLDEERRLMLITDDHPFAAEIFEPVHRSADPSSPKPLRIILLTLIFGNVAVVLVYLFWRLVVDTRPAE